MIATVLLCLAPIDVLDVHPVFGPYLEVADAVGAAQDGDVVRVASGVYDSFAIVGKSITVVGNNGGRFEVRGTIRVQAIAADQVAVVQDFDVLPASTVFDDEPLIVGASEGSIRLSDFSAQTLLGTPAQLGLQTQYAMRIQDASDVVLVGGSIRGGANGDLLYSYQGLSALHVIGSSASLFNCSLQGYHTDYIELGQGGSALVATASEVFVSNSGFRPGRGTSCFCTYASGGDGFEILAESGSHVRAIDSTGGSGNLAPTATPGSTVTLHGGRGAEFFCDRLAPEGRALDLRVTGQFSDIVGLIVSTEAGRRPLPGLVGDLLLSRGGATTQKHMLGRIPFNFPGPTDLDAQLQLPRLASTETLQLHLQTYHMRAVLPSGARDLILGPARVVTVLGSSY